jgi:hypothetical protein
MEKIKTIIAMSPQTLITLTLMAMIIMTILIDMTILMDMTMITDMKDTPMDTLDMAMEKGI